LDELKHDLEALTGGTRFSGSRMFNILSEFLGEYDDTPNSYDEIRDKLHDDRLFNYILKGLFRNIFFIELVNDEISTTRMEVRWVQKPSSGKKQECFDSNDPRFCTIENCFAILSGLLDDLNNAIVDSEKINFLKIYQQYNVLPYEIPIDYKKAPYEEPTLTHIHSINNLYWFWGKKFRNLMKSRSILLNPSTNSSSSIFSKILKDKIKVKTYLTDRVQTGVYKTDREKRWEVHPDSVHFAFRRTSQLIEFELLCQLSKFQNFPTRLRRKLVENEIVSSEFDLFKCPITLDVLSYNKLRQEVINTVHGKSDFQVGHLNPLKAISRKTKGHNKKNISWISSDGNRIQGSLTLEKTRALLEKIQNNYRIHNS